jgi:hypothetical protein
MFCQLLPNKNSWFVSCHREKSEPRVQKLVQCNCEKKENIGHGSFLFAFKEETEWLSGRWLVVSFLHVEGDPCAMFSLRELT